MPKPNSPFRTVAKEKELKSPFERWQENRRERSIDWSAVKGDAVLVAMAAATQAGATLVFGPAMGGQGVVLRVWHGDSKWTEYASSAEQLMQLFELVVEHYESSSEDIYQAIGVGNPFTVKPHTV